MISPIFIFSLPRSGSTLLQSVLGEHPDIDTQSELWILLPFLYSLKQEGVFAEYSHIGSYKALQDVITRLPNGKADYLAAVNKAACHLYNKLNYKKSKYYLDKTPRYHLVSQDIIQGFPQAKFIFLWRNPLAIIASIINTWGAGKWNLFMHNIDMYDGLSVLIQTYRENREVSIALRYEDMVGLEKNKILNEVCEYLDIDSSHIDTHNIRAQSLTGTMGDKKGIGHYSHISDAGVNAWVNVITNPFRKIWCKKYIRTIGRERLQIMGYDIDELLTQIDNIPVSFRYLLSDVLRYFYGKIYILLELHMLKKKVSGFINGRTPRFHS